MDTEILSSSDLRLSNVLKEVLPVASKWYNLGLELDFEPHELDNIRASHLTQVEDCLRELLKKWLSHHSLSPTWRSLVAALKVSTVDSPCVAAQIEGKYADPPDHPVQMDTYTSDSNEAGSSGDIPNMSDITKSANSIIKSGVIPVQPQQLVIVQRERRGVQTEPSVASVANKPIKRDRDESTDSELPKPKKQASKYMLYANKKYEFVETVPQDLLCQKCSQLASDPHQMKCCHKLYCESCLPKKSNRYHRNTSFQECSKGNHKQYESFPDGRSNARIQSLKIMCANNSDGCEWQGELRNLEEHRTQCQKEKIPCNFQEIGCRVLVCRDSVKEHEAQDREIHLDCAMKTIVNVKKANSDLQQQLGNLQKVVEQNHQELKIEIAQCHYPPVTLHLLGLNNDQSSFQGKVWHTDCFYTHRQGYKVCLCFAAVPVQSRDSIQPSFESLIRLVTVDKPDYLPITKSGTATVVIMMKRGVEGQPLSVKFGIDRTIRETQLSTIHVPWIDIRESAWHEIPNQAFPFLFTFNAVFVKEAHVAQYLQDIYFRVDEIKLG